VGAGAGGATGGVQLVDGTGSAVLDWTIFSRFSSTLKLNRRRFGLPRRAASDPAGSGAGAGIWGTGGIIGFGTGGEKDGAGAAGPLVGVVENPGGANGPVMGGGGGNPPEPGGGE
jgi:hypothetical protein